MTGGQAAGQVIDPGAMLVLGQSQHGQGNLGGDPYLSPQHARFYFTAEGRLVVEDLGSQHGTFVGGQRIQGARYVSPGETVQVGQTSLLVEPGGAPAPAPPPQPPAPGGAQATMAGAAWPQQQQHGYGQQPGQAQAQHGQPGFGQQPGYGPQPGHGPQPGYGAPAGGGGGRSKLLVPLLALAALLVVGGVIAAVLLAGGDDEKKDEKAELPVAGPPALVSAARAAGCTAQNPPLEGADHTEAEVQYRTNPPTSGAHNPTPADDAAYEEAPELGQLVHSLEHGRIIMWYRPGDAATRDALRKVGDDDPSKMILTPNETNMPYAAAASAWGHLLGCPEMNPQVPAAVKAFRDAYRGKGPEDVP